MEGDEMFAEESTVDLDIISSLPATDKNIA